ncbi:hypothetical protein Ancab_001656 [Ancistrocladus abbreviatus]
MILRCRQIARRNRLLLLEKRNSLSLMPIQDHNQGVCKLKVPSQETVCSDSQTQEKSAASPADPYCRALSNESHQVLEMDRPQLDSCAENGVRPSAESGVDS